MKPRNIIKTDLFADNQHRKQVNTPRYPLTDTSIPTGLSVRGPWSVRNKLLFDCQLRRSKHIAKTRALIKHPFAAIEQMGRTDPYHQSDVGEFCDDDGELLSEADSVFPEGRSEGLATPETCRLAVVRKDWRQLCQERRRFALDIEPNSVAIIVRQNSLKASGYSWRI